MTAGRQVVQHVSNHRVVLNFKLMTVFEDEHGLGLVGNRSLSRRGRWSCVSFRLRSTWPLRIRICVRTRRLSRASAVEDGGSATVIIITLIFLLRVGIAGIGFPDHRISVRHVNRSPAGKKLAAVAMMARDKRRSSDSPGTED